MLNLELWQSFSQRSYFSFFHSTGTLSQEIKFCQANSALWTILDTFLKVYQIKFLVTAFPAAFHARKYLLIQE